MYKSEFNTSIWIKTKAYVIDSEIDNLGIKQEPQLTVIRISLNEIEAYSESFIEIGGDKISVIEVHMKSGNTFATPSSIKDFDKLLIGEK